MKYIHGIRPDIGQFAQQLLQVFFVGPTIGIGWIVGVYGFVWRVSSLGVYRFWRDRCGSRSR